MMGTFQNIVHELDGIKYDGDKKRLEERLSNLPGCERFHTGWLGTAKKEIVPFIEALNPGDTVFCLFNTHLSKLGEHAKSKYKNVPLNYALIGALQDRVLIITQHGKSNFQIPYSDINKISQNLHITNELLLKMPLDKAKDGRINIHEKNGTNTVFFLDTIGTDTELLGNRFCSWVNKKIGTSEENETKKDQQYEEGMQDQLWAEANLEEFMSEEPTHNVINISDSIISRSNINLDGSATIVNSKEEEEKSEGKARLPEQEYDYHLQVHGIDNRDRELIERIREKYKAPEYEAPPLIAKIVYPPYPNYLSVLTFVLYCLGFLVVILYAYRSEGADGEYFGQTWDNPAIYSADNITIGYVQLYLFAAACSLILGLYIFYKNSGRKLEKTPPILNIPGGFAALLLFIIIPILYFFTDISLTIPCCSTFFLLVTILSLEQGMTFPDRDEKVRKEEEEKLKKRRWFDACKHEDASEYRDATRIWLNLGEDEQVLRVDGLVLEYQYVRVHRRILDMEEKGVNCAKLREHLDLATMLVEDREQGAISFEARIE